MKRKILLLGVAAALLGIGISFAAQPSPPVRTVAVHQKHVYKPKPASQPAVQPSETAQTPAAGPAPTKRVAVAPAAPKSSGRACIGPTAFEAGVNNVRVQHGLPALCTNAQLRQAAQYRANYMCQTNTFSHSGFYGQVSAAYSPPNGLIGENISAGLYSGDAQVVQGFVDSPEHYANIIRADYTEQGAASIICPPPYCTAIGICGSPVPVQINVNDFGG